MEHRFATRCPLPLAVVLYAKGSVVAHGVCRDVSSEGMFVRLRPCRLQRNAIVEVEILATGSRLHALVAHCGQDGVGLVFDDAEVAEGLLRLKRYLQRVMRPGS